MKKSLLSITSVFLLFFIAMFIKNSFVSSAINEKECGNNIEWRFDEDTDTLIISGAGKMYDFNNWYDVPVAIPLQSVSTTTTTQRSTTTTTQRSTTTTTQRSTTTIEQSSDDEESSAPITTIEQSSDIGISPEMPSIVEDADSPIDNLGNSNRNTTYTTNIPTSAPVIDYESTDSLIDIITTTSISENKNAPWINLRNKIKHIVISEGIENIGNYAFEDCINLISITIPNSVTSIGHSAFEGCKNLTSITIPDSVTSIGHSAFEGCKSLTSITIPDSVTSIGDWAFDSCSSLTSITIPEGVTSIGYGVFDGCTSLTSIEVGEGNTIYDSRNNCNAIIETATNTLIRGCNNTIIPDGVTSIGDHAFAWCESLTSITIPDSVTSIGYSAFYNCTNLESITIPDSVTSIGDSAFFNCKSLTSITIPEGVTSIGDWAFYDCTSLTSINIPDGVTSIGDYAFAWCENLTSITIPDSVTSIGEDAFRGCTSLTSITIPEGVTSIGDDAFVWCESLTSITIPNSVTSIGEGAFYYCTSLTSITIPDSVTSIGNSAFEDCTSLTSINIPDGVTSIGEGAFYYCTSLESITIPDSVTSIGSYAFSNCTSLTSITIPDSVTIIGWRAFSSCSSLTSIKVGEGNTIYDSRNNCNAIIETATNTLIRGCNNTIIPDSVTSIGDWAFYYCTSLTSISIPDSVTTIGRYAFYCCSSLKSITIPNSVTSIGDLAFVSCSSLTSITIPEGVTSIGDSTFEDCESLTSITIPDSVTSIDAWAFAWCKNLTSITIPDGVTSIGYGAFYGCTSLTSIKVGEGNTIYDSRNNCNAIIETATNTLITGCNNTIIPDNVTSISERAFRGCSSLTSITIPDGVTEIVYGVFEGCVGLVDVTIPESVKSIGYDAFYQSGYYNDESNWDDGALYIEKHLIASNDNLAENYVVKEGTKSISSYVFQSTNLNNIVIPSSVEWIGYNIFDYSNKPTIGCYYGSYAQQYAKDNNISYYIIDAEPYITLHCPPLTDSLLFRANGVSTINADIYVYDGDLLLGTVKADEYGNWEGNFKLVESENSNHNITAKMTFNGKTVSAKRTIKYDEKSIFPTKLTLEYGSTKIDCLKSKTRILTIIPYYNFDFCIELNKPVKSLKVVSIKEKETKEIPAVFDSKTGLWTAKGYFDVNNYSYVPGRITLIADGEELNFEMANIDFLIDPSGYVYEAVKSNRVENATANIYYQNGNNEILWNAMQYEQDNPQKTDSQGVYHWDVPKGTWRVKVSKDGYNDSYSDWMSVPPEHTDIAIPIVTNMRPEVNSVTLYEDSIIVEFSQYMYIDAISEETVTLLSQDGQKLSFTYSALDAEKSGENDKVYFAKTFSITPSKKCSSYSISIKDYRNYADIYNYDTYNEYVSEEHKHSFLNESINEPKCKEDGKITKKCVCGKTKTEMLDATGHTDVNKDGICDTCKEVIDENLANPCKNAKINVASAKTVDYKSIVTIKATATGVPKGYYLAIYVNGKQVAKGTNTEVTYEAGQVTSDINYTVKVIDAKGNVQKDANGKDLTKDGGKITVNASFFKKLIAFFKGLFGLLPIVTIKP